MERKLEHFNIFEVFYSARKPKPHCVRWCGNDFSHS